MDNIEDRLLCQFTGIIQALSDNDLTHFKKLELDIHRISLSEGTEAVLRCWRNPANLLIKTNFIIMACKENKLDILKYLLSEANSILLCLNPKGKESISLHSTDDEQHNAIYYCIRSNNVSLLRALLEGPEDFQRKNHEDLDQRHILSTAYKEIKLRNIELLPDMEDFIESRLIEADVFSDPNEMFKKTTVEDISTRIEFLILNINKVTNEYEGSPINIDDKFIFILKFIANNIHILKKQIKSSYIRLPWEELEFYLIIFLKFYNEHDDRSIYYRIIRKNKVIYYLKTFSSILAREKDNIKTGVTMQVLNQRPRVQRSAVISQLLTTCPEFAELYEDYSIIRDIHSLEKISSAVNLALAVNPDEQEGKLIIVKALQTIGECIKTTIDSPKLSQSVTDLLVSSAPNDTKKIIISLRDFFSHADSLFMRKQIEQNIKVSFFQLLQEDLKKIKNVVIDLLLKIRNDFTGDYSLNISLAENFFKQPLNINRNVAQDLKKYNKDSTKWQQKILQLLDELEKVVVQDDYESSLIRRLKELITINKYYTKQQIQFQINNNAMEKVFASRALIQSKGIVVSELTVKNTIPRKLEEPSASEHFTQINTLLSLLQQSLLNTDDPEAKANKLFHEIDTIMKTHMTNIVYLDILKNQLAGDSSEKKKSHKASSKRDKAEVEEILTEKVQTLKYFVNAGRESPERMNTISLPVIEVLLLDIMSILTIVEDNEVFAENHLFLDLSIPVLTGKCLRNHLAHDNAIIQVQPINLETAVLCHAKILTELDSKTLGKSKIIGKNINYFPETLKENFEESLKQIQIQQKLFSAIEKGDLKAVDASVKEGADIMGRDNNLWTIAHFAARSHEGSLRFVKERNITFHSKDINGQSPLHIAAKNGNDIAVKFLFQHGKGNLNEKDNKLRTPLHLAAQHGRVSVVDMLLLYGVKASTPDIYEWTPLHYAIIKENKKMVESLWIYCKFSDQVLGLYVAARGKNLTIIEFIVRNMPTKNIYYKHNLTPLHVAASSCTNVDIVRFLMSSWIDIDKKNDDGCTPLHFSSKFGNYKATEALLEGGANKDAITNLGKTPLHFAASSGKIKSCKTLLNFGCSLNTRDYRGKTPLLHSIQKGHIRVAELLLLKEACPNIKDNAGVSPLHQSALNNDEELVKLLINNGIDINSVTNNLETPLHFAVQTGSMNNTEILIKCGANVDAICSKGFTLFHYATLHGHEHILNFMLEKNIHFHLRERSETPLHLSTRIGESCVRFWLNYGIDVNTLDYEGNTPLHCAALEANTNTTETLLEAGADIDKVNYNGFTALSLSLKWSHTAVAKILIEKGALVNMPYASYCSPLRWAIANKQTNIVKLLLDKGANVNCGEENALLLSVHTGDVKMVETLLKSKNIQINAQIDKVNGTAIHAAAALGSRNIVELLIKKGADYEALDDRGFSPLMYASEKGHWDVVDLFYGTGANLQTMSNDGVSAVYLAACNGNSDVLKTLLANGASIDSKDDKNRTPLEVTIYKGHMDCFKTLYHNINRRNIAHVLDSIETVAVTIGNLEVIKYIKPYCQQYVGYNPKYLQLAVEKGHLKLIKYYIAKGVLIQPDLLLHLAAKGGDYKVNKYLLGIGINVNFQGITEETTPLHVVCSQGNYNIVNIYLNKGAIYNATDKLGRLPSQLSEKEEIRKALCLTDKLFFEIASNNTAAIEELIREGAHINARDANWKTPLHQAVTQENAEVVMTLLKQGSDPNLTDRAERTPLFYAAHRNHFPIVHELLLNGAIYEIQETNHMIISQPMAKLLKTIHIFFDNVSNRKLNELIIFLRSISGDLLTLAMNCQNKNRKYVGTLAIENDCVMWLNELLVKEYSRNIIEAKKCNKRREYEIALYIFNREYEKLKKVIKTVDNVVLIDIEKKIAKTLFRDSKYREALDLFFKIYKMARRCFRVHNNTTITLRYHIAQTLLAIGNNSRALKVCLKMDEGEMMDLNISKKSIMKLQLTTALAWKQQGEYTNSLRISQEVYTRAVRKYYERSPIVLKAQQLIGEVFCEQEKDNLGLELFDKVYKIRCNSLGPMHPETLQVLSNIAGVISRRGNLYKPLAMYNEILQGIPGDDHFDLIITKYNIGVHYYNQQMYSKALDVCTEVLAKMERILDADHPSMKILSKILKDSEKFHELDDENEPQTITLAILTGNDMLLNTILEREGKDVINKQDINGWTLLHHATSSGHFNIFKILLSNGANPEIVTNEKSTILHIAVITKREHLAKYIIQNVLQNNREGFNDLINKQTVPTSWTALHIAVMRGQSQIVQELLKHGAIFNLNDHFDRAPISYCFDRENSYLLSIIDRSFEMVKNNDINVLNTLQIESQSSLECIMHTRNSFRRSIVEEATFFHYNVLARNLIELETKITVPLKP